jgi:thiazole synthase ThiGH ThiG subunit
VSTLAWEKPARFLTVPFDLDLVLAQGVGGLPIDAVLVEIPESVDQEFSLAEALRLRALAERARKPLLLHAGPALPASAAASSEHLGADGLLVDVAGPRSMDTLRAYLRSLESPGDR